MKNTKTNYLFASIIFTLAIFATPYTTFGQHCFYVLNLQDSDNCRTELMSETGQMHTNPVQWEVMGDNTGAALACLEPTPDLSGCNDYTVIILEFFFNRTGFLLEDDFMKIQLHDNRSDRWNDILYVHASDLNDEPNKSYHVCAITPDMYRNISDFKVRILVNSSSNGSPMFIRNAEMWMSEITLPLDLTSFTASTTDSRNALLKWTTQNEENVNRFEIERSENATDWTTVGKIDYTETAEGEYTFQDRINGADIYYYRLKIIDNDGQYAYSQVVGLRVKVTPPPRIFPTVVSNMLNVEIDFAANADLYIYDALGNMVQTTSDVSGMAQVDVSKLPAGTYFLQSIFGESRFGETFIISR